MIQALDVFREITFLGVSMRLVIAMLCAKTNAFYKTLGHNFAVFHVDELELQRRAPAVHD